MESFEKSKDRTPFAQPLAESDVSALHKGRGKLLEFKHDPSKVVRVGSFEDLDHRYHSIVDPVSVAGMGKELYANLEREYGIPAPVDFVAGEDKDGRAVIYGITDKIDGENLDRITVTPELTEEVETLYAKVAQYYLDQLPKDGPYLADINNASQYVYGKRKGDESPRVYLVDTDLYIRDGRASLYPIVLWLCRHMISVERKFRKEFTNARATIAQFLDEPLPEILTEEQKEKVEKIVEQTKGYLSGSTIGKGEDDPHPIFSDI